MQRRCDRNRKRSKRRAIYCPEHGCHLDSASQKHSLYTCKPEQLQQRGMGRLSALMLIAADTAVLLPGEWLEAFWCTQCQETKWYYIRKLEQTYEVQLAPRELWQQATGVLDPHGNPSISDFTRRHSRMPSMGRLKDFRYIG